MRVSPDGISGIFWIAVSILVGVGAAASDIGTLHSPGPGFLPFCAALVLGLLGIGLVVKGFFRKKTEPKLGDLWKGLDWKKVLFALASLFLYALLLPGLGYLIATFGLVAFLLLRFRRSRSFLPEVLSAILISGITYLVFDYLMEIQLPQGILGF